MKIRLQIILLIAFLCFCIVDNSIAQKFNPKNRYHSIGATLNTMNYVGELDPGPTFLSPSIRFTRYNLGAVYSYRYNKNLTFRGTLSYGRIKGDDYVSASYSPEDIHRKLRNLNFRNQIYELKADVIYDLIGNRLQYRKRPEYVPYVFMGIAYFHHNPEGKAPDGEWVKLRPLHTEGQNLPGSKLKQYSLHQIAIPLGMGLRYKLNKQWDLAFEVGWRITFTDYLDDVSGYYADKDAIQAANGNQAAAMSNRTLEAVMKDPKLRDFVINKQGGLVNKDNSTYTGSGLSEAYVFSYNIPGAQRGDKNKDWYMITGFHLTYIIPPRVICPKFRN